MIGIGFVSIEIKCEKEKHIFENHLEWKYTIIDSKYALKKFWNSILYIFLTFIF